MKNIERFTNNREQFFFRYINVNIIFGWGDFPHKYNNYSITLINSNKKTLGRYQLKSILYGINAQQVPMIKQDKNSLV